MDASPDHNGLWPTFVLDSSMSDGSFAQALSLEQAPDLMLSDDHALEPFSLIEWGHHELSLSANIEFDSFSWHPPGMSLDTEYTE